MDMSEVTHFETQTDPRDISQLILDGCKHSGQSRKVLLDQRGNTCALGAALIAKYGVLTNTVWLSTAGVAARLGISNDLARYIAHLNDNTPMSREDIAYHIRALEMVPQMQSYSGYSHALA